MLNQFQLNLLMLDSLLLLIGELKESSLLLEIKDNVDRVGLLLPLQLMKLIKSKADINQTLLT